MPITTTCEWFAKCTNQTAEAVSHPALGIVPICRRCADKMGIVPDYSTR